MRLAPKCWQAAAAERAGKSTLIFGYPPAFDPGVTAAASSTSASAGPSANPPTAESTTQGRYAGGAAGGNFLSFLDDYLSDTSAQDETKQDANTQGTPGANSRPPREQRRNRDDQWVPAQVSAPLNAELRIPTLLGLEGSEADGVDSSADTQLLSASLDKDEAARSPQSADDSAAGASEVAFAARLVQTEATAQSAEAKALNQNAELAPHSGALSGPVEASAGAAEVAEGTVTAPKAPARDSSELPDEPVHAIQNDGQGVAGSPPAFSSLTDGAPNASQTREVAPTRPAEAEPLPQPAASRDVALRLADGQSNVDIRMSERAGEIRVVVQTPDRDLANSLRGDLPDLVGKLRQSGFQAETWRPAAPAQGDAGRRSGSDTPFGHHQENASGGRRDRRQQQRQQQDRHNWAGEWKLTLDPKQES
jgi:hypothetical protein